jgi:hypothetical protein
MSSQTLSSHVPSARQEAFSSLAASAAENIPGVDFVSITFQEADQLHTVASTDPLAEYADAVQYELLEGPCYAAINGERFVLVNDLATAVEFPRYAPRVVALGVGAQAAVQLVDGQRRAGLNL